MMLTIGTWILVGHVIVALALTFVWIFSESFEVFMHEWLKINNNHWWTLVFVTCVWTILFWFVIDWGDGVLTALDKQADTLLAQVLVEHGVGNINNIIAAIHPVQSTSIVAWWIWALSLAILWIVVIPISGIWVRVDEMSRFVERAKEWVERRREQAAIGAASEAAAEGATESGDDKKDKKRKKSSASTSTGSVMQGAERWLLPIMTTLEALDWVTKFRKGTGPFKRD